jgi:hypothetical protein
MKIRIVFLVTAIAALALSSSVAYADGCMVTSVEGGACYDYTCFVDNENIVEYGYNCEWGSGGFGEQIWSPGLNIFVDQYYYTW